jgi:hypothetical protein
MTSTNWADVLLILSWAAKGVLLVAVVSTSAAGVLDAIKAALAKAGVTLSSAWAGYLASACTVAGVGYVLIVQQGAPWWAGLFAAVLAVFCPGLVHDLGQLVLLLAVNKKTTLQAANKLIGKDS